MQRVIRIVAKCIDSTLPTYDFSLLILGKPQLARIWQMDFGTLITSTTQHILNMLTWTITFLVIALIAGLLGFSGIAGAAAGIAKILFFVFLVLLVVSLIAGALRGKTPR